MGEAQHSVRRPGTGRASINLTDQLPPDRPIVPMYARRLAAAAMREPDGAELVEMMGLGDYV